MVPKRTIKLREANIVNVSKTQKDKKAYNSDPHLHSQNLQGVLFSILKLKQKQNNVNPTPSHCVPFQNVCSKEIVLKTSGFI